MQFSAWFLTLLLILVQHFVYATFPMYAEHIYRKRIAEKHINGKEFENAVRLYPGNVGAGSMERTIPIPIIGKFSSKFELYRDILLAVDKQLQNPKNRYGEKLVDAVIGRMKIYNLWSELPAATENDRLLINTFSSKALPFLMRIESCDLMNIMSELVSDCKMVADVCVLSAKSNNLFITRKVIDDFFNIISVQFTFVAEMCCESANDRLIVKNVFGLFLEQKTPLINTFVGYLVTYLRSLEIKKALTIADDIQSDSFNSFLDYKMLHERIHRQCRKPHTIEQLPSFILFEWDSSQIKDFIQFMNKLKSTLLYAESYSTICSHLCSSLQMIDLLNERFGDRIYSAKMAVYQLHFGVSTHYEYLMNKAWLTHLFGDSIINEYEIVCKRHSPTILLKSPFKTFKHQMATYSVQPFASYLNVTAPKYHPIPPYLSTCLKRISNHSDSCYSICLMSKFQRVIDRFMAVIYEVSQTYDYIRLGRFIGDFPFQYQSFYSLLVSLAQSQTIMSHFYDNSDLRARVTLQGMTAHIKDTISLYFALGRSGDIYTINYNNGDPELEFLRKAMLQAAITGERLLNGHCVYPEDSVVALDRMVEYIYKQRTLMTNLGAWDESAESIFQHYGPHIYKYK